jgi:hypothetical protein
MPLNAKGEKIKSAMTKQYGEKKGEQVFYASENKGTIKGVTKKPADAKTHKKMREARVAGYLKKAFSK